MNEHDKLKSFLARIGMRSPHIEVTEAMLAKFADENPERVALVMVKGAGRTEAKAAADMTKK